MNLHGYILDGSLADTDPAEIARSYIRDVLALPSPADQVAALEPSVTRHAGQLASSVRRAQRSSGPAHGPHVSHDSDGGPAQESDDSQEAHGGPAHDSHDSSDIHAENGGPAVPAWAAQHAGLIAYCRDHQADHYWIPRAGRRKLAEITADEWLARAQWLTQQSEGAAKSARRVREFASLISDAGTETIGDILTAVTA